VAQQEGWWHFVIAFMRLTLSGLVIAVVVQLQPCPWPVTVQLCSATSVSATDGPSELVPFLLLPENRATPAVPAGVFSDAC